MKNTGFLLAYTGIGFLHTLTKEFHFVHITDSHLGSTEELELHGAPTFQRFAQCIEALQRLEFKPEFLIHTGDVISHDEFGGYERVESLLRPLGIPAYYVVGNHDAHLEMQKQLSFGKRTDLLPRSEKICYRFEQGSDRFLVLDTSWPAAPKYQGQLGSQQLEIVSQELASLGNQNLTIFLHHPPLHLAAPWMNREILLDDGGHLHELLSSNARKIRAVFFGHAHRSCQIMRDGVLYVGGASTFCQFGANPTDQKARFEPNWPAMYNLVTYTADQVIVKQCAAHELANSSV